MFIDKCEGLIIMTKENQKKLYEHFKKLSEQGHSLIHLNAKKHAEEILKSFPEFEVSKKEEVKKEVKKNDKRR